jgi:hypothetical protein
MTAGPDNAGRTQGGQFAPGCSGNPAGMKPGIRHKATRVALALLNGEVEKLTRKAVELALAGDVTALRLCLDGDGSHNYALFISMILAGRQRFWPCSG